MWAREPQTRTRRIVVQAGEGCRWKMEDVRSNMEEIIDRIPLINLLAKRMSRSGRSDVGFVENRGGQSVNLAGG